MVDAQGSPDRPTAAQVEAVVAEDGQARGRSGATNVGRWGLKAACARPTRETRPRRDMTINCLVIGVLVADVGCAWVQTSSLVEAMPNSALTGASFPVSSYSDGSRSAASADLARNLVNADEDRRAVKNGSRDNVTCMGERVACRWHGVRS